MFSLYFSLSLSPLSLSTFSVLQEGGGFFFVGADEKKIHIYIYIYIGNIRRFLLL